MSSNPFAMVYDALWEILERHDGFTDLVRLTNRIKLTGGNRAPFRDAPVAEGHLPEVRLIPKGWPEVNIGGDSCGTSVVLGFEVQISTGDQRVGTAQGEEDPGLLYQVAFEVLRAMVGWDDVLMGLKWKGLEFVSLAEMPSVQEGITDADLNRGILGWSALMTLRVHTFFKTSDLRPEV